MKVIVMVFACCCLSALGQTNIISFTNTDGSFITNAIAIKIASNKLLYRTVSGGGTIALTKLPKSIQVEFNFGEVLYNKIMVQQEEAAQKQLKQEQLEAQAFDEVTNSGFELDISSSSVISNMADGVLYDMGDSVDVFNHHTRNIILLYRMDWQAFGACLIISPVKVYALGLYTYFTTQGTTNSVVEYTPNFDFAFKRKLYEETNIGPIDLSLYDETNTTNMINEN